jgi:ABC-2 type transport system permease protein
MPGVSADQRYGDVSTLMIFRILALASAVFSTSVISQEVEQRTIVYLLTRTVPRHVLLLGRYLASVVVVAAISSFAALLLALATFQAGFVHHPLFWRDLATIVLAAVAYGAFFTFVSLLTNRSMLICLLFAFGWETLVPNMPGSMGRVSLVTYVQALASHPAESGDAKFFSFITGTLVDHDISASAGAAFLVGVIVVCLVMAVLWFGSHEYVPREDAE